MPPSPRETGSSDRAASAPPRLHDLPCIGPFHAARLARINVRTTDDLLRLCGPRAQRRILGKVTGLPEGHLLSWTRFADLMRLQDLTPVVAERLIAAGIDGAAALARVSADRVGEVLAGLKDPPSPPLISRWIEAAAELPGGPFE